MLLVARAIPLSTPTPRVHSRMGQILSGGEMGIDASWQEIRRVGYRQRIAASRLFRIVHSKKPLLPTTVV